MSNKTKLKAVPQPNPEVLDNQEQANALDERAERLISGQEKAPNEFIEYLAGQVAGMRGELTALFERLTQARQAVQQLEAAAMQIQGAHNKTLVDLKTWITKGEEKKTAQPAL